MKLVKTDVSKFYCETKHNPADLIAHPKNYENFQENLFWWTGANFLKEKSIMYKKHYVLIIVLEYYA